MEKVKEIIVKRKEYVKEETRSKKKKTTKNWEIGSNVRRLAPMWKCGNPKSISATLLF
jgi:hypothetical protein